MKSDDNLRIVIGQSEKVHKCRTLGVLSAKLDDLEARTEAQAMETRQELHKLNWKLAVTYAITTILLSRVMGVTLGAFGL